MSSSILPSITLSIGGLWTIRTWECDTITLGEENERGGRS